LFSSPRGLTRRHWIASAALAFTASCHPKRGTGYRGYALIATAGDDSLAVVDLNRFRLGDPIPIGARPAAVVPGGPARTTYVLAPESGTVYTLDRNLHVALARKLADELSEIRVSPDAKRLFAISSSAHQLIEADAASLKVVRRHKLSGEPVSLDVSLGAFCAVSTGDAGLVELFDSRTGRQYKAQISQRLGAVRFRGDGERLLAANLQSRALTVLAVPSLGVIADLPLAMEPRNLCFSADAGQLFISGEGMDAVAIVFPYSPLVIVDQTVLAGRDPGVMACCPNPPLLFVGSQSGSDVCVVNIDPRKVVGLVDVGQRPTYITITPDGQYALVLDKTAGTMALIRIPAISIDPSIVRRVERPPAALFTVLPVGTNPVHAAVVPFV